MEEIELEQIAKKFSIPMVEHQVPADEELEALISQRAVFLLESRLRKADNIQKERMQRFMRTVAELAANDDSRALLAMLVDEFYQATFHAPLEQPSEKMVDMVRPVPAEARQVPQGESVRSEGEKRRRKRSRKKPANGAESREPGLPEAPQAPREEMERDEAVAAESAPQAQASRPQREIEPPVEVDSDEHDDFEPAVDDVAPDETTDSGEAQPAAAPRKRRRRRPRKSSAQKAEAAREGGAEPTAAPPAPRQEPAEPRPAEAAPAARSPRSSRRNRPNPRRRYSSNESGKPRQARGFPFREGSAGRRGMSGNGGAGLCCRRGARFRVHVNVQRPPRKPRPAPPSREAGRQLRDGRPHDTRTTHKKPRQS
jgi:ATP-dependent RNA helicase DeaD